MRNICALLALAVLVARPASAAPPPIEAFARLPQVENLALSPDGRLLAWQNHSGERASVVVYDLEARR